MLSDYYPHSSTARDDRKIKRLRKQLGIEGYGIYFMILEVLKSEESLRYPLEDIDLLADDFGTSTEKIKTVITAYDLFEVDEKEFWSPKLIDYLQPYLQQRQLNSINGIKGNLVRYKHATKAELDEMTDEEIIALNDNIRLLSGGDSGGETIPTRGAIAIKEEKKREKKSKVNKINEGVLSDELWKTWKEYRRKIKKPMTPKAEQLVINKLKNLIAEGYDPETLINNSIEHNWTTIYRPKEHLTLIQNQPSKRREVFN